MEWHPGDPELAPGLQTWFAAQLQTERVAVARVFEERHRALLEKLAAHIGQKPEGASPSRLSLGPTSSLVRGLSTVRGANSDPKVDAPGDMLPKSSEGMAPKVPEVGRSPSSPPRPDNTSQPEH
jgi:hypothetical protein